MNNLPALEDWRPLYQSERSIFLIVNGEKRAKTFPSFEDWHKEQGLSNLYAAERTVAMIEHDAFLEISEIYPSFEVWWAEKLKDPTWKFKWPHSHNASIN